MFYIHGEIEFKSHALRKQWNKVDPRLRGALMEIARMMMIEFGKPLFVTGIARSRREAVRRGQPTSGHVMQPDGFYRAVDARTKKQAGYPGLTDAEVARIRGYWHHNVRDGRRYWSAIHHGATPAQVHIHFQVPKRK